MQADSNGSSDLRHLEYMRQTGPIMVACRGQKNLGFMFETAKGLGVKDTITITLKNRAQIAGVQLLVKPPARPAAQAGMGRQDLLFLFFKLAANTHFRPLWRNNRLPALQY